MRARGTDFLDAPVVGSRLQADAGHLIFLVGGRGRALERVRPVLLAMGGTIYHVDAASGSGMTVKLVVIALFAAQVAMLAETISLAERYGVSPDRSATILTELPVTSAAARAASEILLRKTVPDLSTVELTGDPEKPVESNLNVDWR